MRRHATTSAVGPLVIPGAPQTMPVLRAVVQRCRATIWELVICRTVPWLFLHFAFFSLSLDFQSYSWWPVSPCYLYSASTLARPAACCCSCMFGAAIRNQGARRQWEENHRHAMLRRHHHLSGLLGTALVRGSDVKAGRRELIAACPRVKFTRMASTGLYQGMHFAFFCRQEQRGIDPHDMTAVCGPSQGGLGGDL
ncbi:hypothetical protein J3F83DRAFT_738784 [Trichoderma novae-zelandiae]